MSTEPDARTIEKVSDRLERAIRQNRRLEWIMVSVLVLLFLFGLGLLGYGVVATYWPSLVIGGLVDATVYFPVRQLQKIHGNNVRLRMLPGLLLLADTREKKAEAFRLIVRLIDQVEL